jgi:phospholipid/cholesterol/gamma-HCH transport system permease protein
MSVEGPKDHLLPGLSRMASVSPTSDRPNSSNGAHIGALTEWINDWGSVVVEGVSAIGDLTVFMWRTWLWLLTRLPRKETMLPNFYQVGVLSLPVVALTGTFIGMVLAVQSHFQFSQIGLETRLGAVINMSLVRELGPVLAATMLAGRVGSAMAAELGTMRVTEQIDALESMGANPIHYLVVPRFLACIFLIPILTVMADFMGVVGAYFYSVFILNIDRHFYLHNSREFIGGFDLFVGIFKSLFFGAAIAMISCYRGFNCTPGAEGVGRAATAAFVISFVMILLIDLFLGIVLDTIYYAIWPGGAKLFF